MVGGVEGGGRRVRDGGLKKDRKQKFGWRKKWSRICDGQRRVMWRRQNFRAGRNWNRNLRGRKETRGVEPGEGGVVRGGRRRCTERATMVERVEERAVRDRLMAEERDRAKGGGRGGWSGGRWGVVG